MLAVESGSRAWGFASPNSDYDIRFIYLRPKEHYLKLEKTDDVITPPTEDELDMAGWDLQKALRLMHGSNPSLMEWLSSPIVYRSSDTADLLSPLGIKTVPIIEEGKILPETITELVEYSKGTLVLKKGQKREGVVMRNTNRNISFKVLNPDFLLAEKD